jgi:hypothetical protein
MYELAVPVVCVLAAGVLMRGDYEKYSVFSIGEYRRLHRRSVREENRSCRDCESDIEIGEHRRYYKAIVVAGVEVVRYGGGTATYCYDHADVGFRSEIQPVETFAQYPLWLDFLVGIFELFSTPGQTESLSESEFDNATDDIVASTSDALTLAPTVFLVLFMVMIMAFFKRLGVME